MSNVREKLRGRIFDLTIPDWRERKILPKCRIGRVMQALNKKKSYGINSDGCLLEYIGNYNYKMVDIYWKLTKENGQEACLDSQSDETIEAIYNLLI